MTLSHLNNNLNQICNLYMPSIDNFIVENFPVLFSLIVKSFCCLIFPIVYILPHHLGLRKFFKRTGYITLEVPSTLAVLL